MADPTDYIISPANPPSLSELERWERERSYFEYRAPDPTAREDSPQRYGWGIPATHMPPVDAVEWVISMFRRDVVGVEQRDRDGQPVRLRPEFKWSIVSVCMAHFLWLRTPPGAHWLLKFFGIEEVDPFWRGYSYFWVDTKTGAAVHLEKDSDIELRIFRRLDLRDLSAPIDPPNTSVLEEMKEILRSRRDPFAREPMPEAADDMYRWVSEQLRDWFREVTPNKEWPSRKPNRISGYQWAKGLERKKGVPFYEALDKVELYKSRTYRLKDQRGGVLWCGPNDMRVVPRVDLDREFGTMTEHDLDNKYRCASCRKIRTCLPTTGDEKLCCRCFGSIVERDNRPTLDNCTRFECHGKNSTCPSYISSVADLVRIKNRLNRDIDLPVYR